MKILKTALVALALVAVAASAQADVMIDSFDDMFPPQTVTDLFGTDTLPVLEVADPAYISTGLVNGTSQTGLPNVLGGSRDATLYADPTDPGAYNHNAIIYGSRLIMNNGASGLSARLVLEYGVGAPLDMDFAALSAHAFALEVDSSDLDNRTPPLVIPCPITVTSGLGTAGEATESVDLMVSAEGWSRVAFSEFTTIDWSDVDLITLDLNMHGVYGFDGSFATFKADVPEPATLSLLALGGAVVALRRRR
jgi:hypothetical protein